MKQNFCDLLPDIFRLIRPSEPAQNVMDMATKKSNYNFCLTPMCHVNFAMEKDTNQKF
jgi:hypothetical protein